MLGSGRNRAGSLFALVVLAAVCLGVVGGSAGSTAAATPSTPEPAKLVTVSGGGLSDITTVPALTPAFAASVSDYVMSCKSSSDNIVDLTLVAASGTISAGGESGATVSLQVQLDASQAVVVAAPDTAQPGATADYWIRCLPPDFPSLQSVVNQSEPPPGGWITTGNLTSISGKSAAYAMVLDSRGTPVWWQRAATSGVVDVQTLPYSAGTVAWQPFGSGVTQPEWQLHDLVTGATRDMTAAGSNGGPEEPISPLDTDPHELLQLSNGNFMLIATPVLSGVDLSRLGLGQGQSIDDCVIEELGPSGNLLWSWYASDHVSPDESTRPTEIAGTTVYDVYHCNSIDVDPSVPDPDQANILLSMRNTDAVYLINRQTKQVIWKIGHVAPASPEPDGTSPRYIQVEQDPETAFYGQHDGRFEPNGDISIFDDHTGAAGASRGVEYGIDTAAGTANVDFELQQPPYQNQYYNALALGSFRRYSGGNDNLIGWGANSSPSHLVATELDSGGNTMLSLTFPNGEAAYRVLKYAPTQLDPNVLRQAMGGLPPVVGSVSPSSGPSVGGTNVTIDGSGFTQASQVLFGSAPATSFTVGSDSSISAVAPPGSGTADVTVQTPSGVSAPSGADTFSYSSGSGTYHPLDPYRVLDTRSGLGAPAQPLGPGASLNLQVTGTGPAPDSVPAGATAAVLNLTEADATQGSYLTVWPSGQARPTASNINFGAGGVVPNLVEVGLPADGQVSIYNALGYTDVVADVEGYVSPSSGPSGLFEPLPPSRVLDTRVPTEGGTGPLAPDSTLDLDITGKGGVPPLGASAVVLNVTATDTTAPSYLTVWPAGSLQPQTSNLNFGPGQTVPNRVIVPLGSGGQVSIYNQQGSANVVVDVGGWFTDSSNPAATGDLFTPSPSPVRVVDTRTGPGPVGTLGQTPLRLVLAGSNGVPAGAASIVANATVTDTSAASYLTLYPGTVPQPTVSDLNWSAGQTIANLVVTQVGTDGSWDAFNDVGNTNLVIDVQGWYSPAPTG
jgi:hypothetical protein